MALVKHINWNLIGTKSNFDGEEGAGCFILTVFLMSFDSQCSDMVPWVGLQCVAFPDHTHLLFWLHICN